MKKRVNSLFVGAMLLSAVGVAQALSPQAQEAFEKAQVSAQQALSSAQNKVGAEAKVKEIEFHHTKYGKDYFQVEIFANGQKHQVDVDANNGEILGVESKTPKKVKVQSEKAEPKTTFTQAMDIATTKTGGKVIEAVFHSHKDKTFYEIETLASGQKFVVAVDAENGQIIDMPKKGKDSHHKHHGKNHHKQDEKHHKPSHQMQHGQGWHQHENSEHHHKQDNPSQSDNVR
ncbi:PepSY domain-containing protein [Rodentibacter myodis]|uniref:PepSY domain-containing protein n=1 Tax=Rodentibacter myodis TaxID=1907939 RepID=A0A1V3JGP6_9PAST|nr:PepSY domain-containing protein [Rodentibacter myodis]OOF55788.1 hypothetical protein BKL49_11160 [Rodentibacter myodis]